MCFSKEDTKSGSQNEGRQKKSCLNGPCGIAICHGRRVSLASVLFCYPRHRQGRHHGRLRGRAGTKLDWSGAQSDDRAPEGSPRTQESRLSALCSSFTTLDTNVQNWSYWVYRHALGGVRGVVCRCTHARICGGGASGVVPQEPFTWTFLWVYACECLYMYMCACTPTGMCACARECFMEAGG